MTKNLSIKVCIWIISFALVITDACYAAYRKCETNDLLQCLLKRIVIKANKELSHSCAADYKFCTLYA